MNEQFIWSVNYNVRRIEMAVEIAEPLVAKLASPGSEGLTAEETWQLREAIRSIDSHNRMTREDVRLANAEQRKPLHKRLFRK
jgi:hypothetical protein